MVIPLIVEGRDTRQINQSLYLEYFISINNISKDKLSLSKENPAFITYQKWDTIMAKMDEKIAHLESTIQDIDRMAPALFERTQARPTEQDILQAQMAKLNSLKARVTAFKQKYSATRAEAPKAFNSALLHINNAPDLPSITTAELQRQETIIGKMAADNKELRQVRSEVAHIHHIVDDYHTALGPPKLREKVSAAANTASLSDNKKPST